MHIVLLCKEGGDCIIIVANRRELKQNRRGSVRCDHTGWLPWLVPVNLELGHSRASSEDVSLKL